MFEIGRLCKKLSGRDANQYCVVVEKIDNRHVLIDGNTRRKKCNIKHLEPLDKLFEINKGAKTEEIHKLFVASKIKVTKTEIKKEKKSTEKPVKQRGKKKELKKEKKTDKKSKKIKEKNEKGKISGKNS